MKRKRSTIKEASRTTGKPAQAIRNWIKAGKADTARKGILSGF